jgi:GWxTD domain-containing protein
VVIVELATEAGTAPRGGPILGRPARPRPSREVAAPITRAAHHDEVLATPGSPRALRSPRLLSGLAAALLLLVTGCASTTTLQGLHPAAAVWSAGPVRWLLLAEDRRALARVRSEPELRRFVETFWSRRGQGSEARFRDRAEAADRLYATAALPGSLTDRGRTLILLGPPSGLRSLRRSTPVWDPKAPPRGGRVATTASRFEVWSWRAEELPPTLVSRLDLAPGTMIQVVFRLKDDGADLTEGERYLLAAGRAWTR